jgi:hypothetical protein
MRFFLRILRPLLFGVIMFILIRKIRSKGRETEQPDGSRSSGPSSIISLLFERLNQKVQWYQLPFPLAVANLIAIRNMLREKNLHDTETLKPAEGPIPDPDVLTSRTHDGSYNDLSYPDMGRAGARFARNIPLQYAYPDQSRLLVPNPRTVSQTLMNRDTFKPVPTLNVLAAAWLQFNVHDWFNHGPNELDNPIEVPLDPGDPWREHPMQIRRTRRDPTWSPEEGIPPTFRNTEEHWWGGSQIYGSTHELMNRLRSGEGGKLKIEDGLLPVDPATGIDITGLIDNWWIGLSLLHNLFTLEHNAICDMLSTEYPRWPDDDLYDHARLINAALMAKIHTVEWTPGILNTPVLRFGMRGNWWGVLGEQFYRRFGRVGSSEVLSGIMGSPTDHHSGIYAMTEEFVAVYRMHALLPDDYSFRSYTNDQLLQEQSFPEIAFGNARKRMGELSLENSFYSLGTSHPGAITLHNFPRFLQELTDPTGRLLDLAAVDIL